MGTESTPNSAGAGGNTPTADPLNLNTNANTPQAQSQSQSQTPGRPGGAPARVYMNEKIVPYLLDGMKMVAKEQPSNPLHVLGEYLIQKSNEVEGGGGAAASDKKSPE